MSKENVEAFKRGTEAFNRRDVEAMLEVTDPQIEWHSALPVMLTAKGGVYRGHEGIREMLREIDEVLAEIQVEYSEIRDLDDRIVAIGHLRTRGKESGAAAETPFGYLGDFKDGKSIRIRTYLDPEEALEAAGLRE